MEGDRPLDYFIAHEITHSLTGKAVGPLRYYRLSEWVREGYADYVGKGDSFKYDAARRAFLANAPEMDRWRSGLYLRYHLLVAYLLDKEHRSLPQVLADGVAQSSVEEGVEQTAARRHERRVSSGAEKSMWLINTALRRPAPRSSSP